MAAGTAPKAYRTRSAKLAVDDGGKDRLHAGRPEGRGPSGLAFFVLVLAGIRFQTPHQIAMKLFVSVRKLPLQMAAKSNRTVAP